MSIQPGETTVIQVPAEEIAFRRHLFRLARAGERPPRWPVSVRCSGIHNAALYGVSHAEYVNDPVTHAAAQIAGRKWMLEHVPSDVSHVIVCPLLTAEPSAFGAEIVALPSGRAWAEPWITSGDDLRRLERIDPNHTGSNEVYLEWCALYEDMAERYPVRFEGGEEFYPLAGQTRPLTTGTSDPYSLAVDLMGREQLAARLDTDPPFVRELLDILTRKIIDALKRNRAAEDYDGPVFLGCAAGQALHVERFEELVLPGLRAIKEALGRPVSLHRSTLPPEQVEPIITRLAPASITGFSCADNDLESLAEIAFAVRGRCYLEPHLDSRRLAGTDADALLSEAMQALLLFGRFGRFSLSAAAPDEMTPADLPALGAVRRASCYLGERAG